MSIFIIYIGIIGPQSHFDYTNFRTPFVIKIINFNEIKKMTHLTMLLIFYVDVITVNFSIYHTFITSLLKKTHFLK
jgi:hypothetical protein